MLSYLLGSGTLGGASVTRVQSTLRLHEIKIGFNNEYDDMKQHSVQTTYATPSTSVLSVDLELGSSATERLTSEDSD